MSTLSVSSQKASARRMQFEDCLYENLTRLPYADISISDLCQQVGVSRRAFYRHYHDKEECFCSILNRSFQQFILHVTEVTAQSGNPMDVATAWMEAWKRQRTLTDILIKNNLLNLHLTQLIRFLKEEEYQLLERLSSGGVMTDDDILIYYLGGHLSMAVQWHLRGYDTPTEEMARKFLHIVFHPMVQCKPE